MHRSRQVHHRLRFILAQDTPVVPAAMIFATALIRTGGLPRIVACVRMHAHACACMNPDVHACASRSR
eukprot:8932556-Alexandrium_andersonii.AAC.1